MLVASSILGNTSMRQSAGETATFCIVYQQIIKKSLKERRKKGRKKEEYKRPEKREGTGSSGEAMGLAEGFSFR